MTKTTVVLEFREVGQTTPLEQADGTVLGWAQRANGERYYNVKMSVEDFNRLAPKIFTAQHPPGFEPIPQIVLTEVPDPVKPTEEQKLEILTQQAARLAEQEFAAGAELAMEAKPLPDHASEAAKAGHASMKATLKAEAENPAAEFAAAPLAVEPGPVKAPEPATPHDPAPVQQADAAPAQSDTLDSKLTIKSIRALLADRACRVADIAKATGATTEHVKAFIELSPSDLHLTNGGWIKIGPVPATE